MVSLGVIYRISQFLFCQLSSAFLLFFVNCPLLVHFFFVNYPLIVHFLSIILHFSVFLSIVLLLPTFLCQLSSNCSLFFLLIILWLRFPTFLSILLHFPLFLSIVLQLSTFFVNCTSIVNFFCQLSSFCQLFRSIVLFHREDLSTFQNPRIVH